MAMTNLGKLVALGCLVGTGLSAFAKGDIYVALDFYDDMGMARHQPMMTVQQLRAMAKEYKSADCKGVAWRVAPLGVAGYRTKLMTQIEEVGSQPTEELKKRDNGFLKKLTWGERFKGPWKKTLDSIDVCAEAVKAFHEEGLEFYFWLDLFDEMNSKFLAEHPECLVKTADGATFPGVRDYGDEKAVRGKLDEIAELYRYRPDGLYLSSSCHTRHLGFPEADGAFGTLPAEKFTGFLRQLKKECSPHGVKLMVMAPFNGALHFCSPYFSDHSKYKIEIDWKRWIDEGIADSLMLADYQFPWNDFSGWRLEGIQKVGPGSYPLDVFVPEYVKYSRGRAKLYFYNSVDCDTKKAISQLERGAKYVAKLRMDGFLAHESMIFEGNAAILKTLKKAHATMCEPYDPTEVLGTVLPPKKIFNETDEDRAKRLAWWTHDRFGMFIHFGLYSVGARHEWMRKYERMTAEDYDAKYFRHFNPVKFDAEAWVKAAKDAGMKYIVLTTKHHEGFCLWDTKTTDYRATKTPFGRDIVREYVDACRKHGLRVGFYYSVIDWHHPDYAFDDTHPQAPRTAADFARLNKGRDMARYRAYMFEQVRELMTDYGKIDIVWFDYTPKGSCPKTWQDWNAVELVKMVRNLQPGIIINSRLDLMGSDEGWDFVSPEQCAVASWPTVRGKRVPWEVCHTFSGSWGYHRDQATWKSSEQLVRILVDSVSNGGNLIMNVGPTGRGEFDHRAEDRLAAYGAWMRANGESIYGCTAAPEEFKAPNGTLFTWNPEKRRLYMHVFSYPVERIPCLFWEKVAYAQFLHDGSEIKVVSPPTQWDPAEGYQTGTAGGFMLPVVKPNVAVPVVEIFLKDR